MLTLEDISLALAPFSPKQGLFKGSTPTPSNQEELKQATLVAKREELAHDLLNSLNNTPNLAHSLPALCQKVLNDYVFFKQPLYGHNAPSGQDPFEQCLKKLLEETQKPLSVLKTK